MTEKQDKPEIIDTKAEIPDKAELDKALSAINQAAEPEQVKHEVKKEPKDVVKHSRVDVGKALTLRLKNGLSYEAIGKQLGVSHVAVWKRLKKFEKLISDPEAISAYDANRINLLNSAEMAMLQQMVKPSKLKDASVNNLAYAYKTLFESRRISKGESATNISHHHLVTEISELDREEAELRRELEGN